MLTATARVIKFAFQNFWRNIWFSVLTVTILVLTLLTVNILIVLNVLGKAAVRSVENRIDITVSVETGTAPEIVNEIQSYLSSLAQVAEVSVIEPEEALVAFKERHANDPQILESLEEVSENPFGATLVVRARSTTDYQFILEALEHPTYARFIEEKYFTDHETIIARITRIADRLRTFGIWLAGVFAAIAILIIMNTIRVAIYTYREEIGIMKLVGASNWFVRLPFLLESVIYSVVAVLVTMALVFPLVRVVEPYLQTFFEGTPVELTSFFATNILFVFGYQLLALVVLTIFSSSIAVGRYLKT